MLLAWIKTPIRYNGYPVLYNTYTNELAYEDREHLIELPRSVSRPLCRLIARGHKPHEITTQMIENETAAYNIFVSPYVGECNDTLERLLTNGNY